MRVYTLRSLIKLKTPEVLRYQVLSVIDDLGRVCLNLCYSLGWSFYKSVGAITSRSIAIDVSLLSSFTVIGAI